MLYLTRKLPSLSLKFLRVCMDGMRSNVPWYQSLFLVLGVGVMYSAVKDNLINKNMRKPSPNKRNSNTNLEYLHNLDGHFYGLNRPALHSKLFVVSMEHPETITLIHNQYNLY